MAAILSGGGGGGGGVKKRRFKLSSLHMKCDVWDISIKINLEFHSKTGFHDRASR